MEEKRKYGYENNRQNSYGKNNLVDGNTARKLQTIPDYREEEEEQGQAPLRKPVQRPKKRKAVKPAMDFISLFILCLAVGGTLYTCVSYLKVQTVMLEQKHEINNLEKNLVKVQNENTAALAKLNTSVDLKNIYEVATSQLGMVYPMENQIIPYESNKSDYVKKYGEIPEDNSGSLLDKILNPR